MKKIGYLCVMFVFCLFTARLSYASTITLPRTGQTTCYAGSGSTSNSAISCAGTGQDGDKLKGAAWPTERFFAYGNGTVTDNLTGLIWLKNANCFGVKTWAAALGSANSLASGACGLTDGSTAGQWRLPNVTELESLVDAERYFALPTGHPFTGVPFTGDETFYWSSSSHAGNINEVWGVDMRDGFVGPSNKSHGHYVWPVRAGQ